MLTIEALKNLYVKMGGSLSDTYPFAGGTVGEYTYIPHLIEACSRKYSSGGGAEKFIVTLTQENDTWTADKTIAEIVAAKDADQEVEAHIVLDFEQALIVIAQPAVIESISGEFAAAMFYAVFEAEQGSPTLYTVTGFRTNKEEWVVTQTPLGTTNEPLIVTMTLDESTGKLVGDKTNSEVYSALSAGQAVVLSASDGSATFKLAVQYATFDGTNYEFAFIGSDSVKNTVSGGANDYVTASLA